MRGSHAGISLTMILPYSIAYDLGPVPMEFRVSPANRQIREITVDWRVQDRWGAVITRGRFELPPADGELAGQDFTWTPPRFGWYTVTTELSHQGRRLRGIGKLFGVTPRFPNMLALAEGEGHPAEIHAAGDRGLRDTWFTVKRGVYHELRA